MHLASPLNEVDRYAALVTPIAREVPLFRVPRQLSEHELQAHWFAGDFGRDFVTTSGAAVRIVQFGVWNREAGPDFAEAAISIEGGEPIRGSIELDPEARDWERHGHGENPAYENVVLHVFTERAGPEFFTRTAEHQLVPQVLLDVSRLTDEPLNPQPEAKPGRCIAPLRDLSEERVREVLLGAARHRLQRKGAALARLAELHGPDEALYQGIAAVLGYKSNKLAFTLLAQRLPLKLARAAKEETDALLFGVAGFLRATDLADFDAATRTYLRGLWEKWWVRRTEFERIQLAPGLWKMSGQRPANHPQRRLAALAQLVRSWPRVRALRDACDPEASAEFFAGLSDPYWSYHYTVTSKRAPKPMALVGASRVTELLANLFFPMAVHADPERWNDYKKLPATLSNRRVEVAALRLFGESRRGAAVLKSAALQQGLLQIYEDFCLQDASDCATCPFPTQLARW